MNNQKGFTLLELLISITLIGVLVVILSMALRSGINAYTRSKAYNRFYLPASALYGLLWRQLEAVPDPSDRNLAPFIKFIGQKNGLSFVTTYVPQGTAEGGIFQVAYIYDSGGNRLIYLQKIITSRNDMEKKLPTSLRGLDINDLSDKGWLADQIDDVSDFSFGYEPSRAEIDTKPEDWDERFRGGNNLPRQIAFRIRFKEQDEQQSRWQVIPVGIQ